MVVWEAWCTEGGDTDVGGRGKRNSGELLGWMLKGCRREGGVEGRQ